MEVRGSAGLLPAGPQRNSFESNGMQASPMFGLGTAVLITAVIIGGIWFRIEAVFDENRAPRPQNFTFLITHLALVVVAWTLFYHTRRSII